MEEKNWLISFTAPVEGVPTPFEVDVTQELAERFHQLWREGNGFEEPTDPAPVRAYFCGRCPPGKIDVHEHDATPSERGWLYTEITNVRVAAQDTTA
jgi:hypothetical protein